MDDEIVLLFMAGTFILAGMANILVPQQALEADKRIIPTVVYLALEKLGLMRSRTVRLSGYFALALGIAFLCIAIVLTARRNWG
jgi:hypothetical protein